jgi:uracil-DNA glycosylase family protein
MPEPVVRTLAALRRGEAGCTRCPLYKNATQAVPGEGPAKAPVMLVGEQPGNDEDLAGHPFIGPAGRMLDRAIEQAGLDRKRIFVTNAVKHFKFEQRGKRRLHKRPDPYEIDRCRWWNELERAIVAPKLVVAMGATAARSLTGRPVTITKVRGQLLPLGEASRLMVTIHPSFLLRIPDQEGRHAELARFVDDLRLCAEFL